MLPPVHRHSGDTSVRRVVAPILHAADERQRRARGFQFRARDVGIVDDRLELDLKHR
jgi:hypothetical protein